MSKRPKLGLVCARPDNNLCEREVCLEGGYENELFRVCPWLEVHHDAR